VPTFAYTAPFVSYIVLLALRRHIPAPALLLHTVHFAAVLAVTWFASRRLLTVRPSHSSASILLGIAVFLVWIGPDVLFGYRHHWLFENAITGKAGTPLDPSLKHNSAFLLVRLLTSAALVPVLEELFWRGWLMRWLINSADFLKVPLGTYQPLAFWAVAVLFASEHGPYWEVGLIAGILYNLWLIRTKNLADCMLAHAVTNASLAAYVLIADQWQYWQ
jgi:hypothetical protein